MAGHRKRTGRQPRSQPGRRARERLSSAVTAEDQLAAAYDLFRTAVRCAPVPERPGRMREAAQFLTRLAAASGGSDGCSQ